MSSPDPAVLIRHENEVPTERSTCGMRHRLISREDAGTGVAAWAHVVDIDGAREHYHKRGVEMYYVVRREEGCWSLAGESPVREIVIAPGSSRDSRAGNQTVEALDGKGC